MQDRHIVNDIAASANDLSPVRLGRKLKQARLTKGMRLREVAERAGCSESLLSKVENGKALPSLPLLHVVVRILETNIGWLFEDDDPEHPVIARAGTRPLIRLDPLRRGAGITLERMIPYGEGHLLQCNIHHVDPGGASEGVIAHDGEEIGYVVTGTIELTVDGQVHLLGPGDSFHFRSELPHGYRNPGEVPASILWVNTPPTF